LLKTRPFPLAYFPGNRFWLPQQAQLIGLKRLSMPLPNMRKQEPATAAK
jgi:hypothetical protein